ncbi:MAG: hypothetical protein GF353_24765 [Candidatus Lokiarchaeota archaeon]|nr:hypothetical protein [Candidatus Lokiarchaeota archaeon]
MAGISTYAYYHLTRCDLCTSTDIIETQEGYVCRDCGIMLESQILDYRQSNINNTCSHHHILQGTTIGNRSERCQNSRSRKLARLHKLHNQKERLEQIFYRAEMETSTILARLELPCSLKEYVTSKFKTVWKDLDTGTKFRNPDKLVPLIIYFGSKLRKISIDQKKLLANSKISKKEFNSFKLQILEYFPEYKVRDRKGQIIQRILEITEHFGLGMGFYYLAKQILSKLWNILSNTTEDVIAGVVSSIGILCRYKGKTTVSAVCKRLGIQMSTIQSQVKKKIFHKFKIPGFQSLVKSSGVLNTALIKIGVIEDEIKSRAISPSPKSNQLQIVVDAQISEDVEQRDANEESGDSDASTPSCCKRLKYSSEIFRFYEKIEERLNSEVSQCDLIFHSSMTENFNVLYFKSKLGKPILLFSILSKKKCLVNFIKISKEF